MKHKADGEHSVAYVGCVTLRRPSSLLHVSAAADCDRIREHVLYVGCVLASHGMSLVAEAPLSSEARRTVNSCTYVGLFV